MNWRKGLIRLWLVSSLAWISFFGWEYYDSTEKLKFWQNASVELVERIEIALERERNGIETAQMSSSELKQSQEQAYQLIKRNRSRASNAIYFGPTVPVVFIIIGGIGLWVGRGFKT
jgi:hypothetical protein